MSKKGQSELLGGGPNTMTHSARLAVAQEILDKLEVFDNRCSYF